MLFLDRSSRHGRRARARGRAHLASPPQAEHGRGTTAAEPAPPASPTAQPTLPPPPPPRRPRTPRGSKSRLTATPSPLLQPLPESRVGLNTAPPSLLWHQRRPRSWQGPSLSARGFCVEGTPQADCRQRKPEGAPGTYQVLVGSGATPAAVHAARGLGVVIIVNNKSKHQAKQEEQVHKARSKVSFH